MRICVYIVYLFSVAQRKVFDNGTYVKVKKPTGIPGYDDARIIGSRYNRGVEPTLEDIKRNSRYGDFIINHWKLFTRLVWA
jgi:hypothetical protein